MITALWLVLETVLLLMHQPATTYIRKNAEVKCLRLITGNQFNTKAL